MGEESLSTGFTDVDGAPDADAYSRCLSLLDALPYYREYRRQSYELLDLKPGVRVLDAGCGLGDDVFRMAERIGPGGCAVGLDASESLLRSRPHRLHGGRPETGMTACRARPRRPPGMGRPRGPAGAGRAGKTAARFRHFDSGFEGTFNSFQMAMPISSRT